MNIHGLARWTAITVFCALSLTVALPAAAQDGVLLRGAIFEDLNGDGSFGPSESGFGGVVVEVFADSNGNGAVDSGEPLLGSTSSFADGFYVLPGLPAGSAVVRVHPPVGYTSTVGDDVAVELVEGPVNSEAVVDFPLARTSISAELPIAAADYRGKNTTDDVMTAGDGLVVDVYDRERKFEHLFLRDWEFGDHGPQVQVLSAKLHARISISYNGAALEAQQVLPDGSVISLGMVHPQAQNQWMDVDFDFELTGIETLAELCATELRLTVVDPEGDRGPNEHIKVDRVSALVELVP
jgi:hypothetical protein